jgi:two-component system nitrogen regulation response regulator GlnG
MDKQQESTAGNHLVPSSGQALARRSDALVIRGIRDLEASERAGKERIFVVDDQESLREVICSMLTSAGYECSAFAGGLEAIASLESGEKCDLLLTDLMNYPLDGLRLLERVKQNFPKVEVIIATAIHDDALEEACIRSGAYQYLREPFEREQLLGVVSRALEHRRIKEHHE